MQGAGRARGGCQRATRWKRRPPKKRTRLILVWPGTRLQLVGLRRRRYTAPPTWQSHSSTDELQLSHTRPMSGWVWGMYLRLGPVGPHQDRLCGGIVSTRRHAGHRHGCRVDEHHARQTPAVDVGGSSREQLAWYWAHVHTPKGRGAKYRSGVAHPGAHNGVNI
jgi:hypothetical protein